MKYRYVATSLEGFVQQLACNYLPHGYWNYVVGHIPERKDPATVDAKMLDKYVHARSYAGRNRRKSRGLANVHYLRFERTFVLLGTAGQHEFYSEESIALRDLKRVPLQIGGYSISVKRDGINPGTKTRTRWRSHVRIAPEAYKELRAHFLELAVHRSQHKLTVEFGRVPYARYAPVRRQLLNILREVNRRRRRAGFGRLPTSVLRLHRRQISVFDEEATPDVASRVAGRTDSSLIVTREELGLAGASTNGLHYS